MLDCRTRGSLTATRQGFCGQDQELTVGRPVIVLEFNELTPALMERFIAGGHLPAFSRLRSQSVACVTDSEEVAPNLEPWIQWVTVHTGRSYQEHGVFQLGDGPKYKAPRVWDLVADAGERAWVCGSMNAAIASSNADRLLVLPDPWSVDVDPNPRGRFEAYFDLVKTFVQEYTRESPPLKPLDYIRFGQFMVANGLSLRTVADAALQLAGERVGGPRWRRATILDELQWDVFRHIYRKTRPRFSTFFINSTAHFQHYFWRQMDPHLFELGGYPVRLPENGPHRLRLPGARGRRRSRRPLHGARGPADAEIRRRRRLADQSRPRYR